MKLSAIVGALVRPLVSVTSDRRSVGFTFLGWAGPGFGVSDDQEHAFPYRAKQARIGDLHVAWWGSDPRRHS